MAGKDRSKRTRASKKRGRVAPRKKSTKARKRARKSSGGVGVRLKRWLVRQTIRMGFVGCFVGALGGYWMYQEALDLVDGVLARPIWEEHGRITGDVVVRAGLEVSAQDVASVLQHAGYSRVNTPQVAGDFSIHGGRLFVKDRDTDVLLTFEGGRIESDSPNAVHAFVATELSGLGTGDERRQPITRSEMPENLVLAVLAMEDSRFFEHPGIDAWGIARALASNLLLDRYKQGGSTLTQQLAKNLFLTPERSFRRKVKELALAVALEERLTKDQILELYLNQVYLGSVGGMGICGVDQAAKTYFGTSAKRLNLGQAATLAGVISAPNRYSPARHPERAKSRRNLALKRMVDLGWLEPGARSKWVEKPISVAKHQGYRRAPWALDGVVDAVESKLGKGVVVEGTLTIQTTIDSLLQRVAEKAVKDGLARLEANHASAKGAEAAVVAMEPHTGDILAMVGGRAYSGKGFNRVTQANRQMGSTVKPLSWLALLESDVTQAPTSWVPDDAIEREVNGEIWAPKNYDGEYLGEVTLEYALAQSRNIPAVHVSEWVGLQPLAEHLRRLGLANAKAYPAAALGAFEATPLAVATAYTVFPGAGQRVASRMIRSVRLPNGKEGWVQPEKKERIASPRATFLLNMMMQTTMEVGTGKRALSSGVWGAVGGKTGTTDQGRDAWFVGYTPDLVVAVWVGHDKTMDLGLTGAQAALPIWARIVAGSGRMSNAPWPMPEDVVLQSLCSETGEIAVEECLETKDGWFSAAGGEGTRCTLHSDEFSPETLSIIDRLRERFGGSSEEDTDSTVSTPPDRKRKRRFWRRRRSED